MQQQQGAVLPAILGILALIFVISGQLTEAVLTQHKTNNAFKSQLQAESMSHFALKSTENDILAILDRPLTTNQIHEIAMNESQLTLNQIWQKTLDNYALSATEDRLTGDLLDWTSQPENWWETYANKYSRNNSATQSQTAYSIVEEYQEDFSGSDLGQARDHFSGPSKVLYQVTARGDGGQRGASRVRTILAKTFR